MLEKLQSILNGRAFRDALARKERDHEEPLDTKQHGYAVGTPKRKDRRVHLEPGVLRHRATTKRDRRKQAHESRRRNRHTAGVNR